MTRLDRVNLGARVFLVVTILGLACATRDPYTIVGALLIVCLAATAFMIWRAGGAHAVAICLAESATTSTVIALLLPTSLATLPYLIAPAVIAGASGGVWAVSGVTAMEAAALVAVGWGSLSATDAGAALDLTAPWLLTGLGVGLLGAWLREMGKVPSTSNNASYESAKRLLTQLRIVARRLSAGLDPVSMSAQLLNLVATRLDCAQAAVLVRTEGGLLSPIGYWGQSTRDDVQIDDPTVDSCWTEMVPAVAIRQVGQAWRRHRVVLPLRVGSRMLGVVVADGPSTPSADTIAALMVEVDEHSLRLDTALVFDEVRSIATAEERHRLAREIHDGIAQELASLGYVVDDLAASTTNQEQSDRLLGLRHELSRLVSELRLSIFDLRSEIDPSAGLGTALSDYVRLVGARSALTVHLTLDEAPTRLRSEVETELLRITQEAITNARKHSHAANLWVDCRIRPPQARIEVRDDGVGMQPARDDSYGLRVMRERAERIGARLLIDGGNESRRGTSVVVELQDDPVGAGQIVGR